MPSLRLLLASSALFLLALAAGVDLVGCGTNAMGTDACRKIEQARCRKGPSCPALNVQAGTGVEECVQFARDRCLHGLAVADPGPAAVDACVGAVDRATCDMAASPATLPECAFLRPLPPPVDDAGPDAENTADGAPGEAAPVDTAPDTTGGG